MVVSPTPAPPIGTSLSTQAPALPASVIRAARAGAPLFSWWVPALLVIATVVVVGALAVLRHRRRRTWGTAFAISVIGLVGVLISVGAGVNTYAGYFPTLASVRQFALGEGPQAPAPVTVADRGTPVSQPVALPSSGSLPSAAGSAAPTVDAWHLDTLHLSDPALDIHSREVIVALPPGYGLAGHRYPVAYLLGGYPGRASDWIDAGRVLPTMDALVRAHLSPYYVLVMPDINGGFLTDSEGLNAVAGPQVDTWISSDVTTYVDEHFDTLADRSQRVMVGMSSGGFAALNLSLRHQDTYGITLALEPYGDPGNVRQRLLGGSLDLLHANSPSWYVPTLPLHRIIDLFVDSGSGHDEIRARELADLVAHRHEPVTFRVEPGQGHTWSEAAAGLPYALAQAATELGSATLDSTYPVSDFPPGHRTELSLLLSPDAERLTLARLTCQRTVHTRPGPARQAAVGACLATLLETRPGASPAP